MTIDEAIDILSDNHTVLYSHGDYTEQEEGKAQSMAIRSLEAWEKVKEDINEEIIKSSSNTFSLVIEDVLVHKALDIINKYLKEVEQ